MDIDVVAADHLLTTTRAVRRRLDFDRPVPPALIRECIDVAIQAPTGGNTQAWGWIVVTDPDQRTRLAAVYKRAWDVYEPTLKSLKYPDGDPRTGQHTRVASSALYLAEHMADVPVLVVPCYDSELTPRASTELKLACVLPATWSFMLAARARGLGTSLTTLTRLVENDVNEILGLPEHVTHCAMVPTAFYVGDAFRPAKRLPADQLTYLDRWASPLNI